jgi:hypothetical protein
MPSVLMSVTVIYATNVVSGSVVHELLCGEGDQVWLEERRETLIQINENSTRGEAKRKGRGIDKNIVNVC